MRNRRPRLHANDRCRDQVLRWLEGCLKVPGSFAVSHENAQKIIDLLRLVPVASNPYAGWVGHKVQVDKWIFTEGAKKGEPWVGVLEAITAEGIIVANTFIPHHNYSSLRLK